MNDLVTLLRDRADRYADTLAFRFLTTGEPSSASQEWSFAELDRRSRAAALRFARQLEPGDRVLLLFGEGLDFIVAFFGCLYAGCIPLPVYPPEPKRLPQTLPRMSAIATNARAKAVATTRALATAQGVVEALAPSLVGLKWIPVDELDAEDPQLWTPRAVDPESIACIQYTSGSTGVPKGVVLSHASILANQRALMKGLAVTEGREVCVSWLPLFHDSGLFGVTIANILAVASTTMMSPLTFLKHPMRWIRALSHYRGTIGGSPDFGFARCARMASEADLASLDLRAWRVAINGAEPVREQTIDHFVRVFAPTGFDRRSFTPAYGLAEATLLVTIKAPGTQIVSEEFDLDALERGHARRKPGGRRLVSSGVAWDYDVRIVDPERLVELDEGRVGEIWIRGGGVGSGYWELSDEEGYAFGASLGAHADYLRSGDLGFMLDGELFVTGRIKDMIIVRGRNVYPQDIERVAEAASPLLRPGCSAAVGFEREGQERVVLIAETTAPPEQLAALHKQIRSAVSAGFQLALDDVAFLAPRTIFKTSAGKIQRRKCRDAYLDGSLDALPLPTPEPPPAPASPEPRAYDTEELLALIEAELVRIEPKLAEEFSADMYAADLGLDSPAAADLARSLEQRLDREVPVEVFFGQTLREIAALIAEGGVAERRVPQVPALPPTLAAPRRAAPERRPTERTTVLLTGATGFLGRYLLRELLAASEHDVIALVRAEDSEHAMARINEALAQIGSEAADTFRVRALVGELSQPRLGLGERVWASLGKRLTHIVHAAARIHWIEPYEQLAPANVDAVRELIALAGDGGAELHHVSSLGVCGFTEGAPADIAEDELPPLESLPLGYFQTKWAAEKLLHEARERGWTVSIYRPGIIGGDSVTGADLDTHNQLFSAFVRGAIEAGVAPRLDKVMDVVPVDYVARTIVTLMEREGAAGHSFHLPNPQPMPQLELYEALRQAGYPIEEVAYPTWRNEVMDLPQTRPDAPLARFASYYQMMDPRRMRALESASARRLPLRTDNLERFMAPGDACPPVAELVQTYVRAFHERGLIPAPQPRVAAASSAAARIELLDVYEARDDAAEKLYEKAKARQWNAADRIDWSLDLDPHSPMSIPDDGLMLFGSEVWDKMNASERAELRRHAHAWQISQILHGEQGAMLGACRLLESAPTIEGRRFAATQVFDEARHVEVFTKLLHDKIELSYPMTPPLRLLMDQIIHERRWDMVSLGMQVLIEGLALATFALVRESTSNPLVRAVHAYVMEDEARHVAFGRMTLSKYYPELGEAERAEREEFVVEACYLLRDRFDNEEVYATLGLPIEACRAHLIESGVMQNYRSQLFSRIVPVIRSIGLMGPKVERAFGDMGVLGFAKIDVEALARQDEAIAATLDGHEALR